MVTVPVLTGPATPTLPELFVPLVAAPAVFVPVLLTTVPVPAGRFPADVLSLLAGGAPVSLLGLAVLTALHSVCLGTLLSGLPGIVLLSFVGPGSGDPRLALLLAGDRPVVTVAAPLVTGRFVPPLIATTAVLIAELLARPTAVVAPLTVLLATVHVRLLQVTALSLTATSLVAPSMLGLTAWMALTAPSPASLLVLVSLGALLLPLSLLTPVTAELLAAVVLAGPPTAAGLLSAVLVTALATIVT